MTVLFSEALEQPSPDVLFFPFSDGGLLFRKGLRLIWVLNPASAFIWCAVGEARNVAALAGRYAEAFGVPPAQALVDVGESLAVFRRDGLLGGAAPELAAPEDGLWDLQAEGPALGSGAGQTWAFRRSFLLGGHTLELCCQQDSPGCQLAPLLEHLTTGDASVDTRVAVARSAAGQGWELYLDGRRWVEAVADEAVLPWLLTLAFVRFSQALSDRLLFHAAVLGKGGDTILLPGEAGSGKTTLAAALAARKGVRFFSDELAVFDVERWTVSPFLLPMSIKPGSVELLQGDYPALAGASIHPRSDGKMVRYLLPPTECLAEAWETGTVRRIVFPRYQAGSAGLLTPLEKGAVLQRLVRTGSSNRQLTGADVAALVALVEKAPGYDLVYSDLEVAVRAVETLMDW